MTAPPVTTHSVRDTASHRHKSEALRGTERGTEREELREAKKDEL